MPDAGADPGLRERLAARHLRFGWCILLVYLVLGIILESFHGFKIGLYLDVSNETRRHMWTLAHAHGTLIALVNLAFCAALPKMELEPRALALASVCLLIAGVFMPLGFLLGGVVIYGGDPGLLILLVPPSGAAFALGVGLTALGVLRGRRAAD